MTQETSDLTVKKEGAIMTLDFEADSGMGLENIEKDDLALPFLKLLQSGSYETKKKHAKYVEGAEAGMFYNTVTKRLYDGEKGIEIIPCYYKLTFPEWAPFERSEGRPISNDRGPGVMAETTQNQNNNKDVLKNGNEIIKTANHFVIINGDRPEKALMTMKSTQLKVSRGWNSQMEDQFETDPKTGKRIKELSSALESLDPWTAENIKNAVKDFAETKQIKMGHFQHLFGNGRKRSINN